MGSTQKLPSNFKYRVSFRRGCRPRDIQFTLSGDIINLRSDELHNNNNKYASTRDDNA
jgi:hypothetical protein